MGQEAERSEGQPGPEPLLGFWWKDTAVQEKQLRTG